LTNWKRPGVFLIEIISRSPEETFALGRRVARRVKRGTVIALRGGLGSGKTCFAKGVAAGLGVRETVTSPTYTIISEYQAETPPAGIEGPFSLYHIDAYRLDGDDDFENTGGRELIGGGGVSVIEWSERIERSLPAGAVRLELEIRENGERVFRARGPELAALLGKP
jgi:tRNA threonylcarbamoyladenosine biosynthesis protein TsaE